MTPDLTNTEELEWVTVKRFKDRLADDEATKRWGWTDVADWYYALASYRRKTRLKDPNDPVGPEERAAWNVYHKLAKREREIIRRRVNGLGLPMKGSPGRVLKVYKHELYARVAELEEEAKTYNGRIEALENELTQVKRQLSIASERLATVLLSTDRHFGVRGDGE